MRLLEKLADDKPVASNRENGEPEVTIIKRAEVTRDGDSKKAGETENKAVVRTVVEKNPEDIFKRTMLRKKKIMFKEEVEVLGLEQESGSDRHQRDGNGEENILSWESEEWDEGSEESDDEQDSLCMKSAEKKRRYHDREMQTDPSSGI